jgi:2-polyprenyl-6-methoxyphenol hydroxylase-like FAD-dependent oxidoreductase
MARIVFVGGGIVGLCGAMMLARDGHEVTVLERDAAPPTAPDAAWDTWERQGVNQFRIIHFLLARFRHVADAELPGLTDALAAAGALRTNPLGRVPAQISGGWRDGDERFEFITARRPVAEAVVAAMAASTDGLTIRRGVTVSGVLADQRADGMVHVRGVHTDGGDDIDADLVIDAGGRRSAMPGWLREAGSPGPQEEPEDSGFVYYIRHFRAPDGSMPMSFGGGLQAYGSISTLTLGADNGTWGMGVIASAKDAAMRGLTRVDAWERVIGSYPFIAHWLKGEPLTDVKVMAKIEDRRRSFVIDGVPVATGVLPLGDAWACTNPSLGRGISIGLLHAAELRALLREASLDDARSMALRWHERTTSTVQPYYDDTIAFDRHRLAEIDATIDGRPYETTDPGWQLGQALAQSATKDGDLFRASLDINMLLKRGVDALSQPGLAERAIALADPTPAPGPDRAGLLALVAG